MFIFTSLLLRLIFPLLFYCIFNTHLCAFLQSLMKTVKPLVKNWSSEIGRVQQITPLVSLGPLDQPPEDTQAGSVTEWRKHVSSWGFLSWLTGPGGCYHMRSRSRYQAGAVHTAQSPMMEKSGKEEHACGPSHWLGPRTTLSWGVVFRLSSSIHEQHIHTNLGLLIPVLLDNHQFYIKNYKYVYICRSIYTHILFIQKWK